MQACFIHALKLLNAKINHNLKTTLNKIPTEKCRSKYQGADISEIMSDLNPNDINDFVIESIK